MKFFKKFLKLFIVLVIILSVGLWLYINHLQPKYEGEIVLQNTKQAVSVYFDDYGVPHIYAQNATDALTALGYVHAQDRLWQMELLKRIVPGKLSEIFGETMLKNDMFFSTLGLEQYNKEIIKNLDKNSAQYKQMQAYLSGVNQFIKEGPTPIEFSLLGIKKEPLTMVDIYNIIGYMAFSFAQAQKTDPLLSVLQEKLGENYINQLGIDVSPNTTLIKNFKNSSNQATKMLNQISQVINKTPFPVLTGSNSWVVNGKKSASGKVLFANDPHIGFSQPAVWYEAHVTYPEYEMYGYHIAGIPFPLLGHNHHFAYGLTMFQNDDLDFYAEEVHPNDATQYKTASGYLKFKLEEKTIKIKDREDTIITVKSSHHGPIINNVLDPSGSQPIAMSWMYTKIKNDIIHALFTLSQAKDMQSFKRGASMIHAPGLNVMYGDATGNIAWWASAKLYKLKSNANRKFILDGATGKNDSIEFLDFSENPMAENPNWNYVYSANNQPDSIAGMLYPGYYIPEDRAKRIVTLLENNNAWDKQGFMKMINDVTSSVAPQNITVFSKLLDTTSLSKLQQKAIQILQQWDGSNTLDAVAPTIYNKWIYLYLKNTFEDEMGQELFNKFLLTHLSKRVIASQIQKDSSLWWDNIKTKERKETRKEILISALTEAVSELENQLGSDINTWTWDKVHTVEHNHPIGSINLLRKYFNVGPFAINGSREVINNLMFDYNGEAIYKVPGGPSTRRVIDFSDIENSMSILPTGQSGVPFSKHYKDQAIMYVKGEFRKMKLNKDEIIKTSTHLLIKPK